MISSTYDCFRLYDSAVQTKDVKQQVIHTGIAVHAVRVSRGICPGRVRLVGPHVGAGQTHDFPESICPSATSRSNCRYGQARR